MPNHFCRKLCLLALLICVLAISAVKGASLSPGLEKILSENNNNNDSLISVVIFFR